MKKNRMMRLASTLLILTLLTTSAVSGTFAKYTTEYTAQDTARVAYWGFDNADTLTIDLFSTEYDGTVKSGDTMNVIAPGTSQTNNFMLISATGYAPEVKYTLTVSTGGSTCDDDIKDNPNIKWYLDGKLAGTNGTWDELLTDVNGLTHTYNAGENPTAAHQIKWEWTFSTSTEQDVADTKMGNKAVLDDVLLKITVTATQED